MDFFHIYNSFPTAGDNADYDGESDGDGPADCLDNSSR